MTVPARPQPMPEPPVRGDYTEDMLRKVFDLRTLLVGGSFDELEDARAFTDALSSDGLRLVDTTRESASVDLKVYSAKVEELRHWRDYCQLLAEWIELTFGPHPRPMQEGDL